MADSILVVEDNDLIRNSLKRILIDAGYNIETAENGLTALKSIEKIQPDLIILDLGLPDISGESLCINIKKENPEIVVIMLTAKSTPSEIANGLTIGADDYITKPFSEEELLARIKRRLKDTRSVQKNALRAGDLVLNVSSHEVKRGNILIDLTPQEYKLLECLLKHKNSLVTRDMALNRIWNGSTELETRVVDVYIGYLRKKIDKGHKTKLIKLVRGFGYMLKE